MYPITRNQSFPALYLIVGIIIVGVGISWSEGRPSLSTALPQQSDEELNWKEMELDRVKLVILNELGLHLNPDQLAHLDQLPKANISEAEYRRGYAEYMKRVRMRKLQESGLWEYSQKNQRRNSRRLIRVFSPQSVHTYDNIETRLSFNVNLINWEVRSQLRIKRATIQVPDGCFYFNLNQNQSLDGEIDVTDKLISWVMNFNPDLGHDGFGLTLYCYPIEDNSTGLSQPFSKNDELRITPLTVVYTQILINSNTGGRRRRSISLNYYKNHPTSLRSRDCDKTRHGKSCCRKSMKINFQDLNISDLILEPKEFDAHMCSGRCNGRRVPFSTTHSMFQHTMHQVKGRAEIPKPCCTPTKLRHLDVLHTVPGTDALKITILTNSIVEECSCS